MTMAVGQKRYSKTTYMALCGMFAALMAICSFISIPLGFTPVPVNLGTLGVFLTGGLLGKKYGTISMTVYVLLGAAGVPVFAGFRGGLSVLVGPTGGYIIGYIIGAFIIGLLIETMMTECAPAGRFSGVATNSSSDVAADPSSDAAADQSSGMATSQSTGIFAGKSSRTLRAKELGICVIAMITGLLACYLLGTLWFIVSTHTGVWASLVSCVFPFLPGDALKITAGALLVQKLRHMI